MEVENEGPGRQEGEAQIDAGDRQELAPSAPEIPTTHELAPSAPEIPTAHELAPPVTEINAFSGVVASAAPSPLAARSSPLARGIAHRSAALAVVLGVAAAVRVATLVQVWGSPVLELHRWTQSDMHFYHTWAQDIAAGDIWTDRVMRPEHKWHIQVATDVLQMRSPGKPYDAEEGRKLWDLWLGGKTFYQDPLYPYFVAAIYAVSGEKVTSVVLVQTVLGLLVVGLVYAIAHRLFDPEVAFVAGLMAALFGPLVFYETQLLRSVLQTFLSLTSILLGTIAFTRQEARWFAVTGGAAGLLFLAQSSSLLFIGVMLFGIAWRVNAARRGRALAAFVAGMALAVSPLVIRNLVVGVAPLSIAGSGAVTLINHNAADYDPDIGDTLSSHAPRILDETGGRLVPAVLATLRTHPSAWSLLVQQWGKLSAFWRWYEVPNNANFYHVCLFATVLAAVSIPFWILAPLAAPGLVLTRRKGSNAFVAVAFLATSIAALLVTYNLSRFRVTTACAMIPFAALTAVTLARGASGRRPATLGLALIVLGGMLLSLRPLAVGASSIRVADYGVTNEIAVHLAENRAVANDLPGAIRVLERQIKTEPNDLRHAKRGSTPTRIAYISAQIAGSFASLHELCATLERTLGHLELAQEQQERAKTLRGIDEELRAREQQAREGKP